MKLADYSQRVTADQLDTALRQGGFEGVFHYLSGTPGYVIRVEDPAVVTDIRDKGWPQLGIDLPTLANVDGQAAARAATAYGFGPSFHLGLDIEPSQFNLNPPAWAQAANAWCDSVHAAGFSPGVYGTDQTVAACGNNADWIWRAGTNSCDPAAPGTQGLSAGFFAGRRIVQCDTASYNGVSFDVSYSQFTVGGKMTQDQINALARVLIAVFKGRTPFDQAELDSIIGALTPGNFEATVTKLELAAEYSSAAGVAAVTLKNRLDKLPAGTAAYVRHSHQSTTDTGTPA